MKANGLFFKSITKSLLPLLLFAGLWSCGGGGGGGGVVSGSNNQPQNTAPVITTGPQNTTVTVGRTATFTVVATGTAPLHYQWQKDGANIGTDSASYTTPETTMEDSGTKFTVVVTNTAGHADSAEATLTVKASALDLPKDAEGWTIFTPSLDTRIMYISESGNDSTGAIYNSTSNPDPFNPSGTIQAFATYAAAYANTRAGYPDWILYKRGETFHETIGSSIRNGRSRSEPFFIGAYGSNGKSPLIKTGASRAISISRASPSNPSTAEFIAIQGLHFYAHTRNPEDPEYIGSDGSNGLLINAFNAGNLVRNILVEGCAFMYFQGNLSIASAGGAPWLTDIDIRRNVILHSYSTGSHAQGMWSSYVNNFLVEENIFDHNGWLIQAAGGGQAGGQATMYNHNTYTAGVTNTIFRNNIFMRASSTGTKFTAPEDINGLVIENNLYIDGEQGIDMCNNYSSRSYRIKNSIIRNNVFYNIGLSNPTNRGVAWNMWLQGWDNGLIHNNLMLNYQNASNPQGIILQDVSRGLKIFENIEILRLPDNTNSSNAPLSLTPLGLQSVEIYDNYFERLGNGTRMVNSNGTSFNEVTFSGNTYYSSVPPTFVIAPSTYNSTQWAAGFESDAQFTKRTFPDASRTVETYMTSIGQTGTLDAFIEKCRAQDKYNWDARYTAESVNGWIKAGF